MRLFDAACILILFYESWLLSTQLTNKLDVFARTCYRIMLVINQKKDRLTNLELYKRADNKRPVQRCPTTWAATLGLLFVWKKFSDTPRTSRIGSFLLPRLIRLSDDDDDDDDWTKLSDFASRLVVFFNLIRRPFKIWFLPFLDGKPYLRPIILKVNRVRWICLGFQGLELTILLVVKDKALQTRLLFIWLHSVKLGFACV